MIEKIIGNYEDHRIDCNKCECLFDEEADLDRCAEGQRLLKVSLKWNRRFVYAGKRELGKTLTTFRIK